MMLNSSFTTNLTSFISYNGDNSLVNISNADHIPGLSKNEMSIEKSFSIIVQCFGLIITGYLFGRLNILTQEQSKGISAFTSRIALPALIFISLVEINFSKVNWKFVCLIFFAKLVIFMLVAIATLIITKPANLGLAGVFSIFCTQGNDFAFGYPILSMLYGPAQKEFLDYLYILVPIQLLILNPIGSILIELHNLMRAQGKDKKKKNLILNLVKNLFYNPINVMTFIGIIWNLKISNEVPVVIYFFLDTAAKSFSATALFLLGFSMTGRFQQFKNTKKLLLPLTLVCLKIIISPLINRLFVERGLTTENPDCLQEYSSFSFLYGAIPSAPTAFLYALDYNLKPDIVASAMVICTGLSSPLMFVSANLVRSAFSNLNYKEDLNKFLSLLSVVSLPCIIWVLILFIVSKKYKSITHRCTLVILIAQLGMSTSNYLRCMIKDKQNDHLVIFRIQYLLSVFSVFSLRIWTAVLAITIASLQYRGLCFVLRTSRILFVTALVTTACLFSLVIIFPNYPVAEFDPNFEFGRLQAKISTGLILITLIITIISIVIHHRNSPYARQRTSSRYSQLSSDESDEIVNNNNNFLNTEILVEDLTSEDELFSNDQLSNDPKPNSNQPSTSSNSPEQATTAAASAVQVLDVEDLINADSFHLHCDTRFNCGTKRKRVCRKVVFENCCKSQNLDPKRYELCHANKILDLRQSASLSGLPNNSTLQIRSITKSRVVESVTVCIQLENERQVGEFASDQSLWEIIGTLFPEKVADCNNLEISCLYMRTEVCGIDKLRETKLSTLGIQSGKIAIKLMITNLNDAATSKSSEPSKLSKLTSSLSKDIDEKVTSVGNSLFGKIEALKAKLASKKKKKFDNQVESTSNVLEAESNKPIYEIRNDLIELEINDHKVVLFSQDDRQRLTSNREISEDFFEITKEDVRVMYGDLHSKKSELEDRPLETQKLREQRLSKEVKKYEFTIIRISFPFDHLILQTSLKPTDTIKQLVDLIKQFVIVNDFYLYTAPPKKVLDNKCTFLEEKLVPAALIQFGGHQQCVLKEHFKQQISSFKNVVSYTDNLRNRLRNQPSQECNSKEQATSSNQETVNQEAMNRAKKEERLMKLLNMKK